MYAVLVDAENAKYSSLAPIMEEIATLGADASVRRVYGDFTKPNLAPWKQVSLELSFRPVNAFSYVSGKGSSDAVMIIEAMELLFKDRVDGFALISSDSDFTPLAQRLREAGKYVVGFGQRHTPAPFVTACERFIYTENLGGTAHTLATDDKLPVGSAATSDHNSKPLPKKTLALLNRVIEDAGGDEGWLRLSRFGEIILTLKSDFDVRSYGYRKLAELFQDQSEHFELRRDGSNYSVRLRVLPAIPPWTSKYKNKQAQRDNTALGL
jgi:uncharacterized LabA/DUF88 family protein